MRKFFSMTILAALAVTMAGCGGSEDAFTTPGGSGGATTVSSVSTSSSVPSIPADGSASATITAIAKDANNNAVSGATVTFSASSGSVTVTQGTTDANGVATATLVAAGAAAGTTITVTASSGTASGPVDVTVSNTQRTISLQTNAPQIPSNSSTSATITALVRDASNNFVAGVPVTFSATSGGLTVTQGTTDANGAATATLNAAGDPTNRNITVTASVGATSANLIVPVVGTTLTVSGPTSLVLGSQGTYNVSLTDSGGGGIVGNVVTVTSTAGTPSSPSVTTDSTGHATFQITAATAGNDSVTVAALGLTAQQAITVSGQSFAFTAPAVDTQINLGQVATITVHWTSNGSPVVGQLVNFSSTRGTLSVATATTNGSGDASVTISSNTAGPAVISASATGVAATLNVSFLATNPTAIAVQASPATIPTQGQSTISAIVRDPQNNLVAGQTVNFQLTDITGGSLSVASAVTDAQGRAQTVYTATGTPSSSNGVQVAATVQGTAVTGSTNLTVGGQTVFLSLGTGVTMSENANKTQFIMPWVVQAVDSAGNAVNNIVITLTLHSTYYNKGLWVKGASAWDWTNTIAAPGCANEDVDLNGVLISAEDTNGNGILDPGDVALTTPGTVTTGTDGSATFDVQYPEDHGFWVTAQLTATATVQGTQTSTSATFQLPMLASYVNNIQQDIPGRISPYGTANTCANPN